MKTFAARSSTSHTVMKFNFPMRTFSVYLLAIMLAGQFMFINAQPLTRVQHFGANPGNLRMYMHTPPGSNDKAKMPLVVVLHGCTQNAAKIAKQSGWNKLADTYGFRVIYPQQRMVNNPMGTAFVFFGIRILKKGRERIIRLNK